MAGGSVSPPGAIQRGSLEKAKKMKPFGIFDFLWRRVPLILCVGIPAFIILNIFVGLVAKPVYTVDAKLLITPTKAPSIDGRDREIIQGDVGWFARTLVLRLKNPGILRTALRNLPDSERPSFLKGLGDSDPAVFRLMARLTVGEVERTYMINVSMESNEAEGMAETLNAVLDAFIEKLQEEQERQYVSQMNYLKNERGKIAGRVEQETERLLDVARQVDSYNFLNEGFTGHFKKLDLMENLYWAADGVALDKQAKLEEAKKNQEEISQLDVKPFADDQVANMLGINNMEQWTYVETQDLRKTIDGLTTENTDRKNVEERMSSMLDYLKVYKSKVAEDTLKTWQEKRAYELESDVIQARNAYIAAQQAAEELKIELDESVENAEKVSQAMFRASEFAYGVTELRDRLASIDARIDDAALESKAPLPVIVDQRAVVPGEPTSSNASKLQMMALVASFGLIGGICLAFDFLDPRIRTRTELAAAIGGPGCEPVRAMLPNGKEDADFPMVLENSPDSKQALAIRDMAVRLIAEARSGGSRVVDFIGIHDRCGATSVALLVARALGSHGYRVVLAEMPSPRPGLARMAGLENLPVGPWASKTADPHGAADLVPWVEGTAPDEIRSSLDTFLGSARSGYDFVLLDTISPLKSDLSHETALKSDIAVLVAKQDVTIFGDARKIVQWCVDGGVPALTALLDFSAPNPKVTQAMSLMNSVMSFLSHLHDKARAEVLSAGAKIWGRWTSRKTASGNPQTPTPGNGHGKHPQDDRDAEP